MIAWCLAGLKWLYIVNMVYYCSDEWVSKVRDSKLWELSDGRQMVKRDETKWDVMTIVRAEKFSNVSTFVLLAKFLVIASLMSSWCSWCCFRASGGINIILRHHIQFETVTNICYCLPQTYTSIYQTSNWQ